MFGIIANIKQRIPSDLACTYRPSVSLIEILDNPNPCFKPTFVKPEIEGFLANLKTNLVQLDIKG